MAKLILSLDSQVMESRSSPYQERSTIRRKPHNEHSDRQSGRRGEHAIISDLLKRFLLEIWAAPTARWSTAQP